MLDKKIELTALQRQKIEDHTFKCYPEEMCGFLTQDDFIPVENCAENKQNSFRISALDYAKHHEKITAIVHSHTRERRAADLFDLRTPSYADYINQKETNLPWLIVGCEGFTVSDPIQFPRIPNNQYIGRRFQWFICDCYNLVQDFYRFELNIILPEQRIGTDYKELRHLNDIFLPYYEEYGFREIPFDEITEGDLVLLNHGIHTNNHLGIYTKGQILHQEMISAIVPFENFLGRINKVLRYGK